MRMYPTSSYSQVGQNNNQQPQQQKSFVDYNFKLFSLCGIPIHVHYLLPIFFILTFIFWIQIISSDLSHFLYYVGLITAYNLLLWVTVLIHELGHCFAGYLVGGSSEKIILWPLGGLALTKPPPEPVGQVLNGEDNRLSRKVARAIISFGGPITHIPQAVFWGLILLYNGRSKRCYGTPNILGDKPCYKYDNAMYQKNTWNQTIIIPIQHWFDYDFYMLAFTLNFYLFIVNFFIPAYPLDGSSILVNLMMKYTNNNSEYVAKSYVFLNGLFGGASLILGYAVLHGQSMLVFGGAWGCFEAYRMCMCVMNGNVFTHPLMASQ